MLFRSIFNSLATIGHKLPNMKQIAILLYPGLTPLDAIGPYHVLSQFPGYEATFVALQKGEISDGKGFTLIATKSIKDYESAEILVIPGGLPAITMARTGGPLIDWIQKIHPTTEWTISICTGALMLGDRKSTRLNSSHMSESRMPSSA